MPDVGHPVVTLVGEGGVGKTERDETKFEAIIWTSLKTRALTVDGIKELEGAIQNVLGVFRSVAGELGVPGGLGPTEDTLLAEILTYMKEFRILLTIDNVETLAQESLRPLLEEVPQGSKVLLTSRIGLGEIEIRYPLDPLDWKTAVILMRKFASSLNLTSLVRAKDETLKDYCNKLFMNPLLIKWFVSAVGTGGEPNSLLVRSDDSFVNAVKFCFENLFSRLSDDEKEILHVLASARGPVSQGELAFMTKNLTRDRLEWALNTLHHSSMLRRTLAGDTPQSQTTCYALTEIASEYIIKCAPPPKETFKRVQEAIRSLTLLAEEAEVNMQAYKFNLYTIHADSRDEKMCATYLHRAVRAIKKHDFENAAEILVQAKELLPNYAENYRIAGILEAERGDEFKASKEYQEALALAPHSKFVLYTYATPS
jgi:LuxR family glucitol operon transcriptional activator